MYNDNEDEQDLFENPELLPVEVKVILEEFSEMDNTYTNCEDLVKSLGTVGFTCDYGLDSIPFGLKKIDI